MQKPRFPIVSISGYKSLLEASLAAYQPQWRDEKPVIWSNGQVKAFLRQNFSAGTVTLHITGHSGSAVIFCMSREGWIVHPRAETYYYDFVRGVKNKDNRRRSNNL